MVQIVKNDALSLLRSLPSGSVDAVITDPPYGVNYVYNEYVGSAGFDDSPEYVEQLARDICPEIMRVLRPGGVCYMFVGQSCPSWEYWLSRSGLTIVNRLAYCAYAGPARPGRYTYSAQLVVFACKGSPVWRRPVPDAEAPDMRSFNNTIAPNLRRTLGDGLHPCAKNPGLIVQWLLLSVPHGGLVVDPFIGGGSTALACSVTGRNFVGCELSSEYYSVLQQRFPRWCVDALCIKNL